MQWWVLDWYTVTIRLAPPAVFTFELWIVKDVGDSDESEKRQQFESLHMSNKSRGCKMERRHCFVLAACTRLSLFTPPPLSDPRHHLLHHRDHHRHQLAPAISEESSVVALVGVHRAHVWSNQALVSQFTLHHFHRHSSLSSSSPPPPVCECMV